MPSFFWGEAASFSWKFHQRGEGGVARPPPLQMAGGPTFTSRLHALLCISWWPSKLCSFPARSCSPSSPSQGTLCLHRLQKVLERRPDLEQLFVFSAENIHLQNKSLRLKGRSQTESLSCCGWVQVFFTSALFVLKKTRFSASPSAEKLQTFLSYRHRKSHKASSK